SSRSSGSCLGRWRGTAAAARPAAPALAGQPLRAAVFLAQHGFYAGSARSVSPRCVLGKR
ncbi:hypothetical protein U6K92_12465, partial [Cutibacterium acnes]